MLQFQFHNPTRLVFGEGMVRKIGKLVPADARVLLLAGGGSIRKNGAYDQVVAALGDRIVDEFWGIEPNPRFETLSKAVALCREKKIDFLLPVGGGSVFDGTKFVAAAVPFEGDIWDIVRIGAPVKKALPIGGVLTLPATGSEANGNAVISKEATQEKLYFGSPLVYPTFSVLDPTFTTTLDARQSANGVVDAFVHVCEQYVSDPVDAPLHDRFSEGVLLTLVEQGPKVMADPQGIEARGHVMWAATMALNGLVGSGVPNDWATHGIGHELTAFYGLDHAQTLAVVQPGVWKARFEAKTPRLAHMGRRVWGLSGEDREVALQAIERTEAFYRSLGMRTRLSEYGVDGAQAGARIRARFEERGASVGEQGAITPEIVERILQDRA
ncbi:MAG: iron-containing alcohol dehydrogenase [Fibrobacteria bacterium]|nr:iron-containing alcohol dehydrogenase [Fibrobacteria bacterium]